MEEDNAIIEWVFYYFIYFYLLNLLFYFIYYYFINRLIQLMKNIIFIL